MKKRDRWKRKTKEWHDRHAVKNQAQRHRKSHSVHGTRVPNTNRRNSKNRTPNYPHVTVIPPRDFSFSSNPEETMKFIGELISEIKKKEYRKTIFIDSREVTHVTVDALIYLIAIMENDVRNRSMEYTFVGNFPKDEAASKVFRESGFMDYVRSKIRKLPAPTEKMQIVSGKTNESSIAKECCKFVMDKLNKSRVDIIPLQAVFVELMSNVYHHAYDKDESVMKKKWYIYAEHIEEHVRIVFVDTGAGIARTVKKNFGEQLKSMIGFSPKDSELLKSTLDGDFRTHTGESYRGNGLTRVMEKIKSGAFTHFELISGHGKCSMELEEGSFILESSNYKGMIYGTLYTFEMN